eukprot:gene8878-biopygen18166
MRWAHAVGAWVWLCERAGHGSPSELRVPQYVLPLTFPRIDVRRMAYARIVMLVDTLNEPDIVVNTRLATALTPHFDCIVMCSDIPLAMVRMKGDHEWHVDLWQRLPQHGEHGSQNTAALHADPSAMPSHPSKEMTVAWRSSAPRSTTPGFNWSSRAGSTFGL